MALVRGVLGGGAQSGVLPAHVDHLAACKRDIHDNTFSAGHIFLHCTALAAGYSFYIRVPPPHKFTRWPSVCRGSLVPALTDLLPSCC